MSEEKIYCCFTMDCERIARLSPPGGPENWELSERAITGYVDKVLKAGFAVTLFVVPECAEEHSRLLLSLRGEGVELGMHLHPQSFRDGRYEEYLGGYTAEEQFEILSEAKAVWENALGFEPASFRPGNFSANDSTFEVLFTLGFRQGSCSAPERAMPRFRAFWQSAPRYAHHAHPAMRLIEGELDFLEVPVTVDAGQRIKNGSSAVEFRIEWGDAELHRHTLHQVLEDIRDNTFKTIVSITHNTYDYSDPENERTRALEGSLQALEELCGERGLAPLGATLEQIHRIYDSWQLCSST